MQLSSRDAPRYFARPDPDKTGLLIYGSDAMRVALRRQEVIAALLGPGAEEEMRLARLPAADLRKDPAALLDAIKAQGFFPGPRVAFVEDATDGMAPLITDALSEWRPGDAQVIVTAGALKKTSALRKLFEGHRNAYAVGIYDDPPGRAEIEAMLQAAGLTDIAPAAMQDIDALSRILPPGDFRQTIDKIGLYKLGDDTPLSPAEVALSAPASTETAIDDMIDVVAEGRTDAIGPMMAKLRAQGVAPVTLCIMAMRHFRSLHAAACHPGGAAQGVARMRPPVFGPRRDAVIRQAGNWGTPRLEQALGVLTDTDLSLRSGGQTAPQMAVVERALIRLAMLARR